MAAPNILRFPEDLGTGASAYKKNYLKFTFVERKKSTNKFGSPLVGANILQEDIIYPIIYLPLTTDAFREILTASYSNQELGIFGNFLFNESKMDINNMSVESIAEAFKNNVTTEAGLNALQSFVDTTIATSDKDAVRGAKYAEGLAYNPNVTLFFQGEQKNYRFFRLGWTLYPRTENEATSLLQIEKTLLKNGLPGTRNSSDIRGLNYNNNFTYPHELHLEVYVDNIHFTKFQFLPAYIQYIDVSHHDSQTQNEMSFLKKDDSSPIYYSSTTINLGIQEKEVYVRQYVDQLKQSLNPLNFAP